jgi:hypothetical protein
MPTWRIDGSHIITSTRLIAATPPPGLGSPLPHLRRDPAHRCDVFAGICLTPTTSPPRLDLSLPHLRWDRVHRCQTCVGTWRTATTSTRTRAQCCHICTGTQMWQHWDSAYRCHISSLSRLTESTRVPGPGTPLPLVRRYSSHLRLVCVSTRFASTTFAPLLGSLLPPLHRTWTHRCDICARSDCCHICARPGLTPDSSLSVVVCGFQITRLDVNAAGLTKSPQNSHAGKSAKLHTSAKDLATSAHDARSRKSATSAQHSSPPAYASVTNMCAPTR